MPSFCAVLNCSSRSNAARDIGVRFYRIPSIYGTNLGPYRRVTELSQRRRQMWINALQRTDLTETKIKYGRVCSKHFISGKPSSINDETNPDWVPSKDMGFPKNDDMKLKWLNAIGRESVCKTAGICSDHFNENDFSQNEYATKRRLLSNAVPSTIKKRTEDVCKSNASVNSIQPDTDFKKETVIYADTPHQSDHIVELRDHDSTIIEGQNNESISEESICENINTTMSQNKDTSIQKNEAVKIDHVGTNDILRSFLCSPGNSKSIYKRLHDNESENISPSKKIFVTLPNKGTGHFIREDFTSDRAWNLLKQHIAYVRHERKVLKQIALRRKRRIRSIYNELKLAVEEEVVPEYITIKIDNDQ